MPSVKVFNDRKFFLDFAVTKNSIYPRISDSNIVTKIKNIAFSVSRVKQSDYPNTYLRNPQISTVVKEDLQFRVRFTNKEFLNYGPNNPAPIGIAVIGFNNYIL